MTTPLLSRDLVFLILQFLEEEKFKGTIHKLEQESGLFFNVNYFEELVLNGKWDEVESYLSGFTRVDDNRFSMKIFFEIRKQKYLETLDRKDLGMAIDILLKDLKIFASFNEDLFKEITQLITLGNFRENAQLSGYKDTKTARTIMLTELKKLLDANPLFHDKLVFPNIKHSRLRTLLNQSLNWQHSLCGHPRQNPDIRTLLVDHSCGNFNDNYAQLAASNQHIGPAPRPESFLPMGAHGPSAAAQVQVPSTTWMSTPSIPTHPLVSAGGIGFVTPPIPATMARGPGDSDNLSRTRISGNADRITMPGPSPSPNHSLAFTTADELPKIVSRTLVQGSVPTSMDFHPIQQTELLVGTHVGEVALWEVSSGIKLALRNFHIWDTGTSSMILKEALTKDPCVSVKRVLWSPDGAFFGVAYSKHLVQLYSYYFPSDIRHHLEIDAHVGSVNDLAFCIPNKQLSVITCGDDRTIKVWAVATGARLYTFEGHEDAVHSVCPHSKESINFVFSTSMDGKIKAWLYDKMGSRVDYDAPGHACATMAYSADGKRLFSCGTNKEGESHMVEWNENEGTVRRAYRGFNKRSLGVVQFDITKNRFLAAGDDYLIKIWDMDNYNLLTTLDGEGGLPVSPRIRFNKEGTLLAVSANENRIKILATVDGLRMMRMYETQYRMAARIASDTATKNGDSRNVEDVNHRLAEEVTPMKNWNLTEINEPAQFRSLRLPARVKTDKISRLIYTNSGTGILALALNAIHLFWKWPQIESNHGGKATTKVSPLLVQPASGILVTNDLTDAKCAEAVPCFALSKNDSYVMSASGGKMSLFNMTTFKTMTTFLSPPPAATYLAFHPQDNNVIAVGMDDSTIHIYNVRVDEAKTKLKGHSERISGLAFSHVLNVLVSSGADAQIILWSSDRWERLKSTILNFPAGAMSDTQVQFHHDQIHFLAVNETHLAIYDAVKVECSKQWVVGEPSAPISHAVFSCDSQLVYASFLDGALRIFTASNLQPRCQINPSAYLPSDIISSTPMYPLVVAAHPQDPNQFAVGLSDGGVFVFEPLECDGQWGVVPPPPQNGSAGHILPPPPPPAASNQPQG